MKRQKLPKKFIDRLEDYNKLIELVGSDKAEETIKGMIEEYIK